MTFTPDRFTARVLETYYRCDCHEALWWRVDQFPSMRFFANCSDLFAWGSADIEEITVEDLPLLIQTSEDLILLDAPHYLSELFSARKRHRRPQEAFYRNEKDEQIVSLFDACETD